MRNITFHLTCLVLRPRNARFYLCGIGREIQRAIYLHGELLAEIAWIITP